ncbi:MAG: SAM-dependent methyltransferase [Verrucomicrobia bacterium]|nr:MAG: SAM-dependent methyltransferase [Verrucomicrobiota bacterium]
MPRTEPFESHADLYLKWFEDHPHAYASELAAVRELWPEGARGMEVGVGAGHFAEPLGIGVGVEPSATMRRLAASRGITVRDGTAEDLPFPDASFDAVLMVTTICFVDDPERSLREIHRVLVPGGVVVIGYVDADSALGREYLERKDRSHFYRVATFYGSRRIRELLEHCGFRGLEFRQTLFRHPDRMSAPDPVEKGFGRGGFVAVRAVKEKD